MVGTLLCRLGFHSWREQWDRKPLGVWCRRCNERDENRFPPWVHVYGNVFTGFGLRVDTSDPRWQNILRQDLEDIAKLRERV